MGKAGARVLILYSSFGTGHRSAAYAVDDALGEIAPDSVRLVLDGFVVSWPLAHGAFARAFEIMVGRHPGTWSALCDGKGIFGLALPLSRLTDRVKAKRLLRRVEEFQPDVVVATHFFVSNELAYLRREGAMRVPLMTIITDYYVHRIWLEEMSDLFVVGSEEVLRERPMRDVRGARAEAYGIPVDKKFWSRPDRATCREKLGIGKDTFAVLVMGGGMGYGPYKSALAAFDGLGDDFEAVFLTGRNALLRRELEGVLRGKRYRTSVLPFVGNVHEYLTACDAVVTKPGGLTVAETGAMGAAMVVMDPFPGHEMENALFLGKHYGIPFCRSVDELRKELLDLKENPGRRAKLMAAADRLGRPDAARRCAREALALAGG
ncbi:MAG: glycosyltransferase [Planctomycetota bacterium]